MFSLPFRREKQRYGQNGKKKGSTEDKVLFFLIPLNAYGGTIRLIYFFFSILLFLSSPFHVASSTPDSLWALKLHFR